MGPRGRRARSWDRSLGPRSRCAGRERAHAEAVADMGASAGDVNDWVIDRRLHGLLLRGGGLSTPVDVVRHLTAVQAQEHSYARWAVGQRLGGPHSAAAV